MILIKQLKPHKNVNNDGNDEDKWSEPDENDYQNVKNNHKYYIK